MQERPHITQPKGSTMPRLYASGTATQVFLEPAPSGLVTVSAPSIPKAKSVAKQRPSPVTIALQHPRRHKSRLACSLCCDREPTYPLISCTCGHFFCVICPDDFQIRPLFGRSSRSRRATELWLRYQTHVDPGDRVAQQHSLCRHTASDRLSATASLLCFGCPPKLSALLASWPAISLRQIGRRAVGSPRWW